MPAQRRSRCRRRCPRLRIKTLAKKSRERPSSILRTVSLRLLDMPDHRIPCLCTYKDGPRQKEAPSLGDPSTPPFVGREHSERGKMPLCCNRGEGKMSENVVVVKRSSPIPPRRGDDSPMKEKENARAPSWAMRDVRNETKLFFS